MEPYKVNISAVNQFSKCEFRWWAQYVMGWVPKQEPAPLAFGRLLHLVFEGHAQGMSMEQSIQNHMNSWHQKAITTTDSFENSVLLGAISQLDDMSEALVQWKDQYEFEIPVLEVEQRFEIAHPLDSSIHLIGRPDRVAVMAGRIWHVQNRGLASSTNFGVYTELAKRHYHEHVYAEALNQKYIEDGKVIPYGLPGLPHGMYLSYGGTVFNLVRKLKYRTNITKNNPEGQVKPLTEMFYQYPMSIDLNSSLHKHIMECVLEYAGRMREAEYLWNTEGRIPPPNEDANGGKFGNSPDPYFKVLCGEIELGDERYFKQRIDPYASQ